MQSGGDIAEKPSDLSIQLLVSGKKDRGLFLLGQKVAGNPHRLQHLLNGARRAAVCTAGYQHDIGLQSEKCVYALIRLALVPEVGDIDDPAIGGFCQPADACKGNLGQQADDGRAEGRAGRDRGYKRVHAGSIGLSRGYQSPLRIQEGPVRHTLQFSDCIEDPVTYILKRRRPRRGRRSRRHETVLAFYDVKQRGASVGAAYVNGQNGFAFNPGSCHPRPGSACSHVFKGAALPESTDPLITSIPENFPGSAGARSGPSAPRNRLPRTKPPALWRGRCLPPAR